MLRFSMMFSIFAFIIITMAFGVQGYFDQEIVSAVQKGDNAKILDFLAKSSENETVKANLGTLLRTACQYERSDTALLLLERGADPNFANSNDGETPLIISSKKGLLSVCVALIEKGANLEAADKHGRTALYHAALWNRTCEVEYLIDKGAKPNVQPKNRVMTPLILAVLNRRMDIIKILIKRADMEVKDYYDATPLIIACCSGYDDVADFLIQNGANVNATSDHGRSPLTCAVDKGLTNIVNSLIEKKVNVNEKDFWWQTPLIHACKLQNQSEIVEILTTHGADVNLFRPGGSSPLMYAAKTGKDSVVKYLIEHGANVTFADGSGNTALHLAVEYDAIGVVETLLLNGANSDARNGSGVTPLEDAAANRNPKIVDLIKIKKAELKNELARIKTQFDLMFQNEKEKLTKEMTDMNSKLDSVVKDVKELRDLLKAKE